MPDNSSAPALPQARKIIGATNPLAADPGTIRGAYAVDIGRNIIHGWVGMGGAGCWILGGTGQLHAAGYTPFFPTLCPPPAAARSSDSVENAQKELALWFPEGLTEITPVLYGQARRRRLPPASRCALLGRVWGGALGSGLLF